MFVEAHHRFSVSPITKKFLHNFWQRVNFCQNIGLKKPDTRKQVFCIFRSTNLGKVKHFSEMLFVVIAKRKQYAA